VKLKHAEFVKEKDLNWLGSWCLFHGAEQHLKREALERLRSAVGGPAEADKETQEEVSWEVLAGSDVKARDLLNRCQTGALFGGQRILVVQEAEKIDAGEQQALAKAVGPLPEGVSVVLVVGEGRVGREGRRGGGEEREAPRDERSRGQRRQRGIRAGLRRAIEEQGIAVEFPALKVPEAAQWAITKARELGKKLEPAAARKLVQQRVGTGLGDIESELAKLALFVGDSKIIAGSHVEEATPRLVEEDVFRLVDAVGRRSAGRAVEILRALLEERREEPGRILDRLAQQMRLVWQTKMLLERGWRPGREVDEETEDVLPREERKNALVQFRRLPWLARRTVGLAKTYSWEQLRRAIAALSACDMAIKGIGGKVGEDAVALELLVVQLCADLAMPLWEGGYAARTEAGDGA